MILLTSHIDNVKMDIQSIKYEGGKVEGLLDNWVGNLVLYLTLFSNPIFKQLELEGRIKIYHNTGEEFGLLIDAPTLKEGDMVINVDVCSNKDWDYDVVLDNCWNINTNKIKSFLEWEGYKVLVKKYTGKVEDEDESFEWIKRGIPTISFTIPIKSQNDGWHRTDSKCDYDTIKKASYILQRVICYYV